MCVSDWLERRTSLLTKESLLSHQHTTPEVKRHVPALIEKILRYRPRVMCLLAIGDVLRAVERVFHRWAGEKKVDPVGAYRDQPVSSDWILRKWRIKLSDEGKGDEWTYIVVVSSPCRSLLSFLS